MTEMDDGNGYSTCHVHLLEDYCRVRVGQRVVGRMRTKIWPSKVLILCRSKRKHAQWSRELESVCAFRMLLPSL